eukprot:gene22083-22677_t
MLVVRGEMRLLWEEREERVRRIGARHRGRPSAALVADPRARADPSGDLQVTVQRDAREHESYWRLRYREDESAARARLRADAGDGQRSTALRPLQRAWRCRRARDERRRRIQLAELGRWMVCDEEASSRIVAEEPCERGAAAIR